MEVKQSINISFLKSGQLDVHHHVHGVGVTKHLWSGVLQHLIFNSVVAVPNLFSHIGALSLLH